MNNVVYNIDCMEYIATVPDKFFDLAIVDPQTGQGEDGGKDRRGIVHKKKNWDKERMPKKWIDELFRISKNQILWQAEFYIDYLYPSMGCILWDKKLDNSDYSDFEFAWSSFCRGKKIFRGHKDIDWKGRFIKGRNIHPCQKPIALYKWLLQNYAKPGQKIFDSHVGSGSIRIACHDLGFDFTGCEIDKDYWRDQEERFQNHIANQSLPEFEPENIQDLVYQEENLDL